MENLENKEIFISILPVLDMQTKEYSNKSNYKTFEISFANIQKWKAESGSNKAFASLMNLAKKFDGYTCKISIGLGHSRANTLCQNEVVEFIEDLQGNKKFVRSAKVKWQKNDGTGDDSNDVELIDLFENIFQDIIMFTLQSKEALEFNTVVTEMDYCFSKKKMELYEAVQYKVE